MVVLRKLILQPRERTKTIKRREENISMKKKK